MVFNPSILKSNPSDICKSESIDELASTIDDTSYIYNLLEFNDAVHDIDTSSKISYYRALTEHANNELIPLDEGIIANVVNALSSIIERIINFLRNIARKILNFNVFGKARYKKYDKINIKRLPKESWANHADKVRQINIFYYPNINDIDSQQFRGCLNNIVNELERVCDNDGSVTRNASDKTKAMAFKTLAKLISKYINMKEAPHSFEVRKVVNSETFNEFIKSEICFVKQVDMNFTQYWDYFKSLGKNMNSNEAYAKRISDFNHDLERAKKIVANSVINTEEQKQHANALISQLSAISVAYTSFIECIARFERDNFTYHSNMYAKYIACEGESTNESGMIHGENFNSDTLFDNEDVRDFNRTEWLDLDLTTECYELKYDLMETSKRIALQEAMILSDDRPNKFGRLIVMREAEEKKLGDRFKDTIERIRQFLNKFMEGIKDRSADIAKSIQRNTTFINKPVKIREIRSKGDIIAGMYRVQQRINIIPFNYETMKDDLKDKRTFFEKRILPNMKNTSQYAKRKLEWNNDTSITDYCKVYYGASMPDEDGKYPKCEFTTQDIEVNKNNIVKFLNQPNNAFSCKSDLDALEAESKKVASRTAQNQNTNNPQSNDTKPAANNAEAKQESMYYSELYNTWFTEADIEMGNQSENKDGENNNSNNSSTNEEATAYKNYMECYKDIILAKMTAAEFIFAEMTQIINAHARSYMSTDQKKTEDGQANKNANAAPANNT